MKKLLLGMMGLLVFTMIGCGGNTTAFSFDASRNITVYTRDTTSGTRDAFFTGIDFSDAITSNGVLVANYVEVDGNGSMITSVKNDIYGIGYISLASLETSGLKGLVFDGVAATEANVLNGTYTLKRPFNYMTRAHWSGMERERQIVEAFVAFMTTIEGIATIQNKAGIISVEANTPSWDDIKSLYPVCLEDNSDVTIYFGGSTSVESVAKALSQEFSQKCGNFIAEHNHTGSGDAYKRTQGSEADGGNKLHIGFASRDFKSSESGDEGTSGFICFDAVVLVVNQANTAIDSITKSEAKKVYSGDKTLWSSLNP
ncbi:MAG: substrate-binding domain-containing protein [Candidatus Izemoplasmatales bacterium]|nr:substrate-binding domain-containing protein [Candidatus Izemoplasmatales bacterium]MDD5293007.1 substrate-binding domain-containing protein [Candidatus Izemoplasmatales bacterium]